MQIEQTEVMIPTPDGQMPAFLCTPAEDAQKPAIILLMEAFGLTPHIRDVAARIAKEGYVVLAPDLYYRIIGSCQTTSSDTMRLSKRWR